MKKCDVNPACPYLRHNWLWRLRGRCNHRRCVDAYIQRLLPEWRRMITEALEIVGTEAPYEEKQAALDRLTGRKKED